MRAAPSCVALALLAAVPAAAVPRSSWVKRARKARAGPRAAPDFGAPETTRPNAPTEDYKTSALADAADASYTLSRRLGFLRDVRDGRLLQDVDDEVCLEEFVACEEDAAGCLACVLEIMEHEEGDVEVPADFSDWDCDGVVSFLHTIHVCEDLEARDDAAQKVCGVWAACATEVLDDDATTAAPAPAPVPANCSATACEVPHAAWLGDGACDADISQCYNTAACGWDGGDCCEATCRDTATRTCGTAAPYVCRDPDAQGCGSRAAAEIELEGGAGAYDYALYSVILDGFAAVSSGSYAGAASTTPACLADGCYVMEVKADSTYSSDPRWAVKKKDPQSGALVIAASGGGPAVCTFPVGGGVEEYCPAGCVDETADNCNDADQYVMAMTDAGWNGWGFVGYRVHKHDAAGEAGEEIRAGTLAMGHFGVEPMCIPDPGCYTVTLEWGWWSEEVSWELGKRGAGAVAAGGAPAQCDFSVGVTDAGQPFCPATCAPADDAATDDHLITGGCDPDDASKLPYALEMYDADGDGWGGVRYTITDEAGAETSGSLNFGFQGQDDLCLAPGCYDFSFPPRSSQSRAAGWALGDVTEGGVVFSGSSSASCVFAVGGGECPSGPHTKEACGFDGVETPPPTSVFECDASQALAVMRVVDSWGDGWNGADFTITDAEGAIVGSDTLRDGAYAEFPYCVDGGCYNAAVSSGEWREEVSWQLVELLPDGTSLVRAHGAAPEQCGFALAAGNGEASIVHCDTACATQRAASDDWKGIGDDDFWNPGWDDAASGYAYDYGDGYAPNCEDGDDCGVFDNFAGWAAASAIVDCLDQTVPDRAGDDPFVPELWADRPELCEGTYDFGELDAFEACAKELEEGVGDVDAQHAKAKACMALLVSAAPDGSEDLESDDELVKRLATMVYYAGDVGFCDCATNEEAIPACNDFADFRAVVREAHEACDALDAIDCAYLGAYAAECETGLVNKFGVLDLASPDQCAYVDDDGCGGMAIPAVRKWDCLFDDNYELTAAQKTFVLDVVTYCVDGDTDDGASPKRTDDYVPPDHKLTDDDAHASSHRSDDDGAAPRANPVVVAFSVIGVAAVLAAIAFVFYKYIYKQSDARPGRDDNAYGVAFAPLGRDDDDNAYVAPGGV